MSYFKALRFTQKIDREIELQKQCQNSINEAIKYYEEKLGRNLSLMEQCILKNKIIKDYYGDMRYENKVGE